MAALNFPDALSDGQTFEADTGVIYVYQGIPPAGFWSATNTVNGQQNQDARYVQRAGDDMTGNLTFNTDKIQLKAQDGSASFAGNIKLGNTSSAINDGGIELNQNLGQIDIIKASADSGYYLTGVQSNGAGGVVNRFNIAADGSAVFRGVFTNGSATNYVGTYLETSTGTDLYGVNSNSEKWRIKGDGSATFAGGTTIQSSGNVSLSVDGSEFDGTANNGSIYISRYGTLILHSQSNANDATAIFTTQRHTGTGTNVDVGSQIFADGSAKFATGSVSIESTGIVQIDTGDAVSSGNAGITYSGSNGARNLRVNGDGTVGIGGALQGGGGTIFEPNIKLSADGSATFAGSVTTNVGFYSDRPAGDATNNVFRGKLDGNITSSIKADGSANFASSAEFGVISSSSNSTGVLVGPINSQLSRVSIYNQTLGTAVCFQIRSANEGGTKSDRCTITTNGAGYFKSGVTSDGTFRVNLDPDNAANYTTTTDAEGNETSVYNGPTLDVKDRLSKADAALQTLKTAAAAAADFAALKSAIATALADI